MWESGAGEVVELEGLGSAGGDVSMSMSLGVMIDVST
jgi:hypothetical protein